MRKIRSKRTSEPRGQRAPKSRIQLPRFSWLAAWVLVPALLAASGQSKPDAKPAAHSLPIALREVSRSSLSSEQGGAFMLPAKCDADGNLYIRKFATDRPLLSPV